MYILIIAYIIAINFYAFLLVKSLRDKERVLSSEEEHATQNFKYLGKLLITGALGGAILVYVSMFIFKFKRDNLLLMVAMPLLGVINIYLFIALFRAGFGFFIIK